MVLVLWMWVMNSWCMHDGVRNAQMMGCGGFMMMIDQLNTSGQWCDGPWNAGHDGWFYAWWNMAIYIHDGWVVLIDANDDNNVRHMDLTEEAYGLPYIPMNRSEMGPKGFSHRFHKCERLLSQLSAEAFHLETELLHCWSHRSVHHLCPIPSESPQPSLHRGTKIALSVNNPFDKSIHLALPAQKILKNKNKNKILRLKMEQFFKCLIYLNYLMILVLGWPAIEAKCAAPIAIQAIHVAFTPCCVAVGPADGEKSGV